MSAPTKAAVYNTLYVGAMLPVGLPVPSLNTQANAPLRPVSKVGADCPFDLVATGVGDSELVTTDHGSRQAHVEL